jgi:hypothetical protein
VRLGEVGGDLGRRDRIARGGDQGRSLEQGTDGRDVRAFESDLGEAVLRDLHGGAGLPHLLAQSLHLGDRETGIVRDDDDVGGLEDPVQRRDGRFLFRSIHVGTLFGWRLVAAGCTSRPDGMRAVLAGTQSGRTTTKACPPDAKVLGRSQDPQRQVQRFEPIAPASSAGESVSPVYAGRLD